MWTQLRLFWRMGKVPRDMCSRSASGFSFDLSEEQQSIKELSDKFVCEEVIPVAAEHDRTGEFPWDIVRKAHALGLHNTTIPEEYGGLGASCVTSCLVDESFAYGCQGIGSAVGINNIACAPLAVAANHEQKTEYFGRLVSEPLIASYCVTEPGAGSDVSGLQTKAIKHGNEWVVNGNKMWITGGGVANWYFLLALTDPDPRAKTGQAFTAFIVDADLPGVVKGRKEINMGQRASNVCGITFEDVRVSEKNVIGNVGEGFIYAMNTFDKTRPGVAAAACGLAARALDEAAKYSLQRSTFGQPIANHQAIQHMLAEMASGVELARTMTLRSAWDFDEGRRNTYFASIAKLFASDVANRNATDCVQIFGGNGYNSEYPAEKLFRDAKIFHIYEGTSQIQKLLIAREFFDRLSKR